MSLPVNDVACSRIERTAESVAEEALSWITPLNPLGRSMACRNQSMITSSISVAAGDVCQSMHWDAIAFVNCSAIIEAGAAFDWK